MPDSLPLSLVISWFAFYTFFQIIQFDYANFVLNRLKAEQSEVFESDLEENISNIPTIICGLVRFGLWFYYFWHVFFNWVMALSIILWVGNYFITYLLTLLNQKITILRLYEQHGVIIFLFAFTGWLVSIFYIYRIIGSLNVYW